MAGFYGTKDKIASDLTLEMDGRRIEINVRGV